MDGVEKKNVDAVSFKEVLTEMWFSVITLFFLSIVVHTCFTGSTHNDFFKTQLSIKCTIKVKFKKRNESEGEERSQNEERSWL